MSEAASTETGTAQAQDSAKRGLPKFREGYVVSASMDKSVVVKVTTHKRHPKYGKFVLSSQKYVAHDETNQCGEGDRVRISECRPLSKTKRWRVREILEKAV